MLFAQEAGGGVLFGLVLGGLGYYFTKSIEAHGIEVLITLALVVGGYAAAFELGVSGPLAMVVAGLVISFYKEDVFAENTRELAEGFWELLVSCSTSFCSRYRLDGAPRRDQCPHHHGKRAVGRGRVGGSLHQRRHSFCLDPPT